MRLGDRIKRVREAKGLSQKQAAAAAKMDQGQYSRIENNVTDPSFSSVEKIAKAIGVSLPELFKADEVFKEVSSLDKSVIEKVGLIEGLDKKERTAFYTILDALVMKKKMRDSINKALNGEQ